MSELEKKFIEHFNEPYNIQLREKVPFLLVSLAHDLAEIAEKYMASGNCRWKGKSFNLIEKEMKELKEHIKWKLEMLEENTKLKKQLAITKEKIIKVLEVIFESKNEVEEIASKILGEDNEK